jgi:regulator of replication initiation timing
MTMFQSDLKADSGANQFTRGETTGGIVSGKAINSLIQAGGKVASMRTEQLKYGFKSMVEQIIWLMAQFYDDERTVMITGREGNRQINVDTKKLFGKKSKGAVNPPPYTVQIEVSSRDPQRIANQNQMFMEAYTMSAQAQQFFPLSSLFRILNLDGKDKILPVIEQNEHYQEQMQALQQQVEQMQQQMEQVQAENQNLRKTTNQMTNTLASMSARNGGAVTPGATKVAEAGGGPDTANAVVNSARNTLGLPTGAQLPT